MVAILLLLGAILVLSGALEAGNGTVNHSGSASGETIGLDGITGKHY